MHIPVYAPAGYVLDREILASQDVLLCLHAVPMTGPTNAFGIDNGETLILSEPQQSPFLTNY